MLKRINNLMYGCMFIANIFLMLLGCVVEYEPITIIVLGSGLAISLASFLLLRLAKQIYITSDSYNKQTKRKKNEVA